MVCKSAQVCHARDRFYQNRWHLGPEKSSLEKLQNLQRDRPKLPESVAFSRPAFWPAEPRSSVAASGGVVARAFSGRPGATAQVVSRRDDFNFYVGLILKSLCAKPEVLAYVSLEELSTLGVFYEL